MSSVREAYVWASSFLKERGVGEAERSAELLLEHVLGTNRTRLLAMWSDPVGDADLEKLRNLVLRRAEGEPVQYIVGEAYFCGRRFAVDPNVLIPRPETELLVERVLLLGDELWGRTGTPRVADLGTGSGAIAVSLAASRPSWRVAACDISPGALAVARRNAAAHGVGNRIAFLEGDWLLPAVEAFGPDAIDAVVANPPYIPTGECGRLQVEVSRYEPSLALDGGEDGMVPYRRMLEQMAVHGVQPRLFAFECGLGQARELARMVRDAGSWPEVSIVEDFAGIERHVIGVRRTL